MYTHMHLKVKSEPIILFPEFFHDFYPHSYVCIIIFTPIQALIPISRGIHKRGAQIHCSEHNCVRSTRHGCRSGSGRSGNCLTNIFEKITNNQKFVISSIRSISSHQAPCPTRCICLTNPKLFPTPLHNLACKTF